MREFDIIKKFFTRSPQNLERFPLGIGDDAALISVPPHCELATSIDTLNEGVHFPANSAAYDIGHKSLAVSLSDLAAMGAQASAVLLALTLPNADPQWLEQFAAGFFHLADQYQVELIGGNTTQGPLSISTVTYGWAPAGQALRRSNAKAGDDIYVTGTLGDAGLALQYLQQQWPLTSELQQRFFRPQPRLEAGLAIRNLAHAAIDISDGLAADLGKMLQASNLGGEIQCAQLPLSPTLRNQSLIKNSWELALTAGDDYELCFTAPPEAKIALAEISKNLSYPFHYIGRVSSNPGLKIYAPDGTLVKVSTTGYQHFS